MEIKINKYFIKRQSLAALFLIFMGFNQVQAVELENRFGIGATGGYQAYQMDDVNKGIYPFTGITSGWSGGVFLLYGIGEECLVRYSVELLTSESVSTISLFTIPITSDFNIPLYLNSVGVYYVKSTGKNALDLRLGGELCYGITSSDGKWDISSNGVHTYWTLRGAPAVGVQGVVGIDLTPERSWLVGVDLGYRYLKMANLYLTPPAATGLLPYKGKNPDGSDVSVDYSGMFVKGSLAYLF